jgi:hypothetical protein
MAHRVHVDMATGRRTVTQLHPEPAQTPERVSANLQRWEVEIAEIDARAERLAIEGGWTRHDYREACKTQRFRLSGQIAWRKRALIALESEGRTYSNLAAMSCGIDR